ncbi:MAG TPA: ABC transporter ATP-binding protein [Casimicrobiaceae bacterium]|nr:ABC transporter ATP-binding protein [Casimicrobiaceae bacterium]
MSAAALRLAEVAAGYGEAIVISGISLTVAPGEALAVLGRNGAGKTTLVNTIVGVTRRFGGSIAIEGVDMTHAPSDARARAGIGWVPQERNVFRSLSVEENLTAVARPGAWTQERIYDMFPRLLERRRHLGGQLSGGEQQMLAIARALVTNPRVLLLDEPTEGLAPIIVMELLRVLKRLFSEEGMAAIVVEQHAQRILAVTTRAIILERGAIVHAAPCAELAADAATLGRYLGVEGDPRRGAGGGGGEAGRAQW